MDEHFSPEEHLPENIFKFLQPITVATCQGFYAVAMVVLSALAALANGAAVPLWNQKCTPLMAILIHVAKPQKGAT